MRNMRCWIGLLLPCGLLAQAAAPVWETADELTGVDFSVLSAAQKKTALDLMRENGCACGCIMKIAECRMKDPKCGTSRPMAAMIVRELHEGKTVDKIRAELAARMASAPKLLDDPVAVPIAGAPVKGPADAKITLVEFSDFQCPYCARAVAQADAILRKHPKEVRLVFKQYPLDIHSQAELAAEAALAAHAQGKFWEMHDKLFANSHSISRDRMLEWAKEIGLDAERFRSELDSRKYKPAVEKEIKDGDSAGVQGTPTFFVNGKRYNGSLDPAAFEPVLTAEMTKK